MNCSKMRRNSGVRWNGKTALWEELMGLVPTALWEELMGLLNARIDTSSESWFTLAAFLERRSCSALFYFWFLHICLFFPFICQYYTHSFSTSGSSVSLVNRLHAGRRWIPTLILGKDSDVSFLYGSAILLPNGQSEFLSKV